MDIQQSCFSGVMLAVGRLVGIEKTIGDKVSSKYIRRDYLVHIIAMRKMSKTRQNARVQTFAQVVDSFVDRCLSQVTIK